MTPAELHGIRTFAWMVILALWVTILALVNLLVRVRRLEKKK